MCCCLCLGECKNSVTVAPRPFLAFLPNCASKISLAVYVGAPASSAALSRAPSFPPEPDHHQGGEGRHGKQGYSHVQIPSVGYDADH